MKNVNLIISVLILSFVLIPLTLMLLSPSRRVKHTTNTTIVPTNTPVSSILILPEGYKLYTNQFGEYSYAVESGRMSGGEYRTKERAIESAVEYCDWTNKKESVVWNEVKE